MYGTAISGQINSGQKLIEARDKEAGAPPSIITDEMAQRAELSRRVSINMSQ